MAVKSEIIERATKFVGFMKTDKRMQSLVSLLARNEARVWGKNIRPRFFGDGRDMFGLEEVATFKQGGWDKVEILLPHGDTPVFNSYNVAEGFISTVQKEGIAIIKLTRGNTNITQFERYIVCDESPETIAKVFGTNVPGKITATNFYTRRRIEKQLKTSFPKEIAEIESHAEKMFPVRLSPQVTQLHEKNAVTIITNRELKDEVYIDGYGLVNAISKSSLPAVERNSIGQRSANDWINDPKIDNILKAKSATGKSLLDESGFADTKTWKLNAAYSDTNDQSIKLGRALYVYRLTPVKGTINKISLVDRKNKLIQKLVDKEEQLKAERVLELEKAHQSAVEFNYQNLLKENSKFQKGVEEFNKFDISKSKALAIYKKPKLPTIISTERRFQLPQEITAGKVAVNEAKEMLDLLKYSIKDSITLSNDPVIQTLIRRLDSLSKRKIITNIEGYKAQQDLYMIHNRLKAAISRLEKKAKEEEISIKAHKEHYNSIINRLSNDPSVGIPQHVNTSRANTPSVTSGDVAGNKQYTTGSVIIGSKAIAATKKGGLAGGILGVAWLATRAATVLSIPLALISLAMFNDFIAEELIQMAGFGLFISIDDKESLRQALLDHRYRIESAMSARYLLGWNLNQYVFTQFFYTAVGLHKTYLIAYIKKFGCNSKLNITCTDIYTNKQNQAGIFINGIYQYKQTNEKNIPLKLGKNKITLEAENYYDWDEDYESYNGNISIGDKGQQRLAQIYKKLNDFYVSCVTIEDITTAKKENTVESWITSKVPLEIDNDEIIDAKRYNIDITKDKNLFYYWLEKSHSQGFIHPDLKAVIDNSNITEEIVDEYFSNIKSTTSTRQRALNHYGAVMTGQSIPNDSFKNGIKFRKLFFQGVMGEQHIAQKNDEPWWSPTSYQISDGIWTDARIWKIAIGTYILNDRNYQFVIRPRRIDKGVISIKLSELEDVIPSSLLESKLKELGINLKRNENKEPLARILKEYEGLWKVLTIDETNNFYEPIFYDLVLEEYGIQVYEGIWNLTNGIEIRKQRSISELASPQDIFYSLESTFIDETYTLNAKMTPMDLDSDFRWDSVPGIDNKRMLDFLKERFAINWLHDDKGNIRDLSIEKTDENTIKIILP